LLGFDSPFTQPSSTSSGTSTYICINSLPMRSFACRYTCGYVAPQRSSPPPKGLLRRTKSVISGEEGDQTVEKDCQFGCLNFSYKSGVVSPVTAYRNKWPSDWQQQWLYHTVTPLTPGESHPLATKELPPFTSRI
jgi:hypothetical protein